MREPLKAVDNSEEKKLSLARSKPKSSCPPKPKKTSLKQYIKYKFSETLENENFSYLSVANMYFLGHTSNLYFTPPFSPDHLIEKHNRL